MILAELFESISEKDAERDLGRYEPARDTINVRSVSDTRKPKLTLRMLNRIRKIRATRELEMAQMQDLLRLMFNPPAEGEGSF